MKNKNILDSFFHVLTTAFLKPAPLEMDYFTSCCYFLYISFYTLSIVRHNLIILRNSISNPAGRRLPQIFSIIKLPEKTQISKMDSKDCLQVTSCMNSEVTSLEFSSKKFKLYCKNDKEALATSDHNSNALNISVSSATSFTENSRKRKKRKTEIDASSSSRSKERPNYYLAVSISDPEICSSVEKIQQSLISQDERIKNIMLPLNDLHVTIMVMNLKDDEMYKKALKTLHKANEDLKDAMLENPLNLEFQGIGHFDHRVIFAKLLHNDSYNRLADLSECLKSYLGKEDITSTDLKREFSPHLTIGKIKFRRKFESLKKISPSLYEPFKDQYFGKQIITGFVLYKMIGAKDPVTGCRIGDEFLFQMCK